MGAFRQNFVRQDGRIRAKSCATFGKIVRHFPQSHRKINPCVLMDGRRDLAIGSNEWSWCVYVPFDTFGYRKLAKNAQKL